MTTKQLHAQLRMLPIAPTPRSLITKDWARILEAQRQRLLLVMIKIETTNRSGILRAQTEIPVMQAEGIEILPQLLPKTGLEEITLLQNRRIHVGIASML